MFHTGVLCCRRALRRGLFSSEDYEVAVHYACTVSRLRSSVLDSRWSPRPIRPDTRAPAILSPMTAGTATPVGPRSAPMASYAVALPSRFAPWRSDSRKVERPINRFLPYMTPVMAMDMNGMESRAASAPLSSRSSTVPSPSSSSCAPVTCSSC